MSFRAGTFVTSGFGRGLSFRCGSVVLIHMIHELTFFGDHQGGTLLDIEMVGMNQGGFDELFGKPSSTSKWSA